MRLRWEFVQGVSPVLVFLFVCLFFSPFASGYVDASGALSSVHKIPWERFM